MTTMARTFVLLAVAAIALVGQVRLKDVHKIHVGSLGNYDGAEIIRDKIVAKLAKSGQVTLVEDPAEADAVLTGSGIVAQGERHGASVGQYGGIASGGTVYGATAAARFDHQGWCRPVGRIGLGRTLLGFRYR